MAEQKIQVHFCLHKADLPAEPAHGQAGNLQVVQLGRK